MMEGATGEVSNKSLCCCFLSVGLSLEENNLSGTIPTEVGLMSKLEVFSVAKNNITGSLPDVWDNMPNLCTLQLSYKKHLWCGWLDS
jgi:hypothetical protein